jgi:hypothetical protein
VSATLADPATGFPPSVAGWNRHFRTLAAAAFSNTGADERTTLTFFVLPFSSNSNVSQTVPGARGLGS